MGFTHKPIKVTRARPLCRQWSQWRAEVRPVRAVRRSSSKSNRSLWLASRFLCSGLVVEPDAKTKLARNERGHEKLLHPPARESRTFYGASVNDYDGYGRRRRSDHSLMWLVFFFGGLTWLALLIVSWFQPIRDGFVRLRRLACWSIWKIIGAHTDYGWSPPVPGGIRVSLSVHWLGSPIDSSDE